jgi:subtilase family serine protease
MDRSRHAPALTAGLLLLSGVLVAGCSGRSGSPAAPTASPATTAPAGFAPSPHQYRVAYGIQPLLDRGIDGRGETVTILSPAPSPKAPPPGPGQPSAGTDIRQEVSLPASDPLVLAVGGGFSHLYGRPSYQDGVPGIAKTRGVPDVAGAGNGSIPIVFADGGQTYTAGLGGTSLSAPLWGGLAALADQYARHDLGFVNPAIYRIARGPGYHQAFHDVTTGDNDVIIGSVKVGYSAAPGWDPVTGWGTPDAQVLVPLLAR